MRCPIRNPITNKRVMDLLIGDNGERVLEIKNGSNVNTITLDDVLKQVKDAQRKKKE